MIEKAQFGVNPPSGLLLVIRVKLSYKVIGWETRKPECWDAKRTWDF